MKINNLKIKRTKFKKIGKVIALHVFVFLLTMPILKNHSYFLNNANNSTSYFQNYSNKILQADSQDKWQTSNTTYLPNSINDEAIKEKIQLAIEEIHDKAKEAFTKIERIFPTNDNENVAKDFVFLLNNITDRTFHNLTYSNDMTFYQKLFDNLLKIIKYNISDDHFLADKPPSNSPIVIDNIPYYLYLQDHQKQKNINNFFPDKNFIKNTLTIEQRQKIINYFLNQVVKLADINLNNLSEFSASYLNWFKHLDPTIFKSKSYDETLDQNHYQNFLEQLSTTKNNQILNDVYQLKNIQQNYVDDLITKKYNQDLEVIKKLVDDKDKPFFVDITSKKLADILDKQNSDTLAPQIKEKWNVFYSKISSIVINPELTNTYPDLTFRNFWPRTSNRLLEQVDIFATIVKNNAVYWGSDFKIDWNYNNDTQKTFNFLSELLKQKLSENLNKFIALKSETFDKIQNQINKGELPNWTKNDFTIKQSLNDLKSTISLNYEFKPASVDQLLNNWKKMVEDYIPIDITLFVKNSARTIFYPFLTSNSRELTPIRFVANYKLDKKLDIMQLIKKLEIAPIYKSNETENNPSIQEVIHAVNNGNGSKYFIYNNPLKNLLTYQAFSAEILSNGNLNLTTKLTNSLDSSFSYQYKSEISKDIFLDYKLFDKQAKQKSIDINNSLEAVIGSNLYDQILPDERIEKFFQSALMESKTSPGFKIKTIQEQVAIFATIYQQKINEFLKSIILNNGENGTKKIETRFNDFKDKLEQMIKEKGLNPNDSTFKKWFEIIEQVKNQIHDGNFDFGSIIKENPQFIGLMNTFNNSKNQKEILQYFNYLLQQINPSTLSKVTQTSQKAILSVITGVTGFATIALGVFMMRTWKISGGKYQNFKKTLLGASGAAGLAILATFIYLIVILAGAG